MIKQNYMQAALIIILFTFMNSCSKKGSSSAPTEAVPQISISDVSKAEGNGGTTQFTFTVTLDKAYSKQVTVDCATAEGWAKTGEDFTALSQTITFQPNETQKNISVTVVADDVREGNDDF
ncbi:MAG: Calx-beta domain-containing protein, partial [Ferruginibacter sp.]